MSVYAQKSYKTAIRDRIKDLQTARPSFTLKRLAGRIRIQYTYLSKVLNDGTAHLSEDRLFEVCRFLELDADETDFLLLLRGYETADAPEWREHLYARIEKTRKAKKLKVDVQDFNSARASKEMEYLFDPLAKVVLISLFIPNYQKNPRLICPLLGITPAKLKEILRKLADVEHIELEEGGVSVKRILKKRVHYGQDHPLMRVHQTLLKTVIQSQLLRTSETEKQSVLVTFDMDTAGFERIKDEFQIFLKRVEEIAAKARDEGTYQISFDLFKWL